MLWSAADLLMATGGVIRQPFDADGIAIDSRGIAPGELFVALTGSRDGHQFVAAALAKGAAGALCRRGALDLPPDAPVIEVDDPLAALRAMAQFARARFGGRLVAVTGSVGKTTTKEMLRALLTRLGRVHAAAASFNNHIGVPLTLARLPADADFAVIEIGMNHPGEIAPLAALARPDVAVVTNVGSAHIGHLGSLAAIAREKAAIFGGLPPGGVAVFPADAAEAGILEAAARAAGAKLARAGAEAGILAQTLDAHGSDLRLRVMDQVISARVGAPGRHMANNALLALTAVQALGGDLAVAAPALAAWSAVAGRGARRQILAGRALLLDESYNASTLSVRAALELLSLTAGVRRIAVLGDMREMGEMGPAEHASLAPDVLAHADLLFTCGPLMRHLHDAVPAALAVTHAEDAASLAPQVAAAIRPGDAVLVKGSFGSNMSLVVAALLAPPEEHLDAL